MRVAGNLLGDNDDLRETRVAFLVAPGFDYAAVQRGIWRAGGVAVPLAVSHPAAELEYVIKDAGASIVVAGIGFDETLKPLAESAGARYTTTMEIVPPNVDADLTVLPVPLPHLGATRRAMIVYTSGTTGKPKGAV